MAEMWRAKDISVYREWVKTILDEASDTLNDWENKFINDIDNRLDDNRNLTQRQAEILESIYANKTH
jgi:hypothetical protein